MEINKTRAEIMAETYQQKLIENGHLPKPKQVHHIEDRQTPEKADKLRKAVEKLRTFLD